MRLSSFNGGNLYPRPRFLNFLEQLKFSLRNMQMNSLNHIKQYRNQIENIQAPACFSRINVISPLCSNFDNAQGHISKQRRPGRTSRISRTGRTHAPSSSPS